MILRLGRYAKGQGGWTLTWAAACLLGSAWMGVAAAPTAAPEPGPSAFAEPQASSAEVVAPDPSTSLDQPPPWRLDIDAPPALATLLRSYLDLARFQEERQDDADRINLVELRRLVVSAPEQARALLEAEGYFGARISTRVTDAQGSDPMVVLLRVDPGPRTQVGKVQILFEGELDNRVAQDEAGARELAEALQQEWDLPAGKPFKQADWSAAKNATLARLRAQGYPTASWSGTSVTVDAERQSASLFLVADSGPAFFYGDIQVEGLRRQPSSAVTNLAPFRRGDPYKEGELVALQDRIQKVNLFDNVFVSADVDPTSATGVPVVVQVRELPLQQATVGVGVSSDTGPRVSFEHLHRQPFDTNWQAKTKLQWGREESNLQLDLTSHPWPGRKRGLLSTQMSYQIGDDNSVTTSQRLRVGRLREGERLERTDYLEFQRAEVSTETGEKVSQASSVAGTTQWIFRDVDSQILPTRGTTTSVSVTGGRSFSTLESSGYFGRAHARLTGYLPLPGSIYLSARGEWGQVATSHGVSVPDTLLFRAGGDESVRGYAYRSLGVLTDGVVVGGRALVTGSIELARPFVRSSPNWLGAVFVDAGDAASTPPDLHINVGYGAGVRWRSPVGPLKLDVAYGREVRQWRLHFSVGISL